MSPIPPHPAVNLLAQATPNFWDQGLNIPPQAVLVVALVMLAVFGTIWVRQWYKRARMDSTPVVLFHQLAAELGIGLPDQWVLVRIARQQGLPTPLVLLLSAPTLKHHADIYLQTLPQAKRPLVRTRVESIARLMFGDGRESDGPTAPLLTRQPTPTTDPLETAQAEIHG